jgi:hypothetical protein
METWSFSETTMPETRREEMTGSKKVDLTRIVRSVWTRSEEEALVPVLMVVTLRSAWPWTRSPGTMRL